MCDRIKDGFVLCLCFLVIIRTHDHKGILCVQYVYILYLFLTASVQNNNLKNKTKQKPLNGGAHAVAK